MYMKKAKRPSKTITSDSELDFVLLDAKKMAVEPTPIKQDVLESVRKFAQYAEQKAQVERQKREALRARQLGVNESTVSALRQMFEQLEQAGLGQAAVQVSTGIPTRRLGEPAISENRFLVRAVLLNAEDGDDSDDAGNLVTSESQVVSITLHNSFPSHLRGRSVPVNVAYEDEDADDEEDDEDGEDGEDGEDDEE